MSGQREGLVGDIFNKVKDLLTDDELKNDPKQPEDPPLETQCCGKPPVQPVVGSFEHEADCPNHPDNLTKQEVAS